MTSRTPRYTVTVQAKGASAELEVPPPEGGWTCVRATDWAHIQGRAYGEGAVVRVRGGRSAEGSVRVYDVAASGAVHLRPRDASMLAVDRAVGLTPLGTHVPCLALRQPYASLLFGETTGVVGPKRYETRTWRCSYAPAWIAIYATRWPDAAALRRLGQRCPAELPYGAILGVVYVAECRPMVAEDAEGACVPFSPMALRYVWELTAAYRFERPNTLFLRRGPQKWVRIPTSLVCEGLGTAQWQHLEALQRRHRALARAPAEAEEGQRNTVDALVHLVANLSCATSGRANAAAYELACAWLVRRDVAALSSLTVLGYALAAEGVSAP